MKIDSIQVQRNEVSKPLLMQICVLMTTAARQLCHRGRKKNVCCSLTEAIIYSMQGPHRCPAPCPHLNLPDNCLFGLCYENMVIRIIQGVTLISGCGVLTGQFEFHSAVVDECPVNPVAEGFKGSDAEHSRLLLPQVLIGPSPERVLSKYTTRD